MVRTCPKCDFEVDPVDDYCRNCGCNLHTGAKQPGGTIVTCGLCGGKGQVQGALTWHTCPTCKGVGKVRI